MNKKTLIIAAAAILISLGALYGFLKLRHRIDTPMESFAKCITSEGMAMYGLKTCPHCDDQKKLLEEGFKYIDYVECSKEAGKCSENKIVEVPVWILKDGQRFIGSKSIQELSEISSCPVPPKK